MVIYNFMRFILFVLKLNNLDFMLKCFVVEVLYFINNYYTIKLKFVFGFFNNILSFALFILIW